MRILVLVIILAACHSSRGSSRKAPLPATTAPEAENDVFRLSAHRMVSNAKHIRIWLTLENKTDQDLTVGYGDFMLERDGKTYPGALRVPFVRVTKSFPMTVGMVKRFPDAIEFLGAPSSGDATIRLVRYSAGGESRECDLAMKVQLVNERWE